MLGHIGLLLVLVALVVALIGFQRWMERLDGGVLTEAMPRFATMLEVSRLGDALSEIAGVLAVANDQEDRRAALDAIAETRAALTVRMGELGRSPLEDATRERLNQALADMAESIDTLDDMVTRRLALTRIAADLNTRLGILGDGLPDLEQALLKGRATDHLGGIIDLSEIDFPSGPSGTRAAVSIRGWARHVQVGVGMMLAASGAGGMADLDYLAARTEESLRRAAAASREGDRAAMPVMEAVLQELSTIAEGGDGADSVFRARRQALTMRQNVPTVLDRTRQASDRVSAAVTQILADLEQGQTMRAAERERAGLLWQTGVVALAGLGALLALWSGPTLWAGSLRRLRRLTDGARTARDGGTPVLTEPGEPQDEIGVLARAVEGLDAEFRRVAQSRRVLSSRLSGLLAAVPQGVLLMAADRTIEDASPTAAHLLGHPVDTLLGRPLPDLLPPGDRVRAAGAIAEALHRPGTAPPPMDLRLPASADPAAGSDLEGLPVTLTVLALAGDGEAIDPVLVALLHPDGAGAARPRPGGTAMSDGGSGDLSHAS